MPWGRRKKAIASPVTRAVLTAFHALPKGNSFEIAALAGSTPEYVRVVLQRNGLQLATRRIPKPPRTTPVRRYRRLQEWEEEAIAQAYVDGEKLEALAAEFDVDQSTISRLALRRGFQRRSGPTARPKRPTIKYRITRAVNPSAKG